MNLILIRPSQIEKWGSGMTINLYPHAMYRWNANIREILCYHFYLMGLERQGDDHPITLIEEGGINYGTTSDNLLTRIFDEEKENIGLADEDIALWIPETWGEACFAYEDEPKTVASAWGVKEEGYNVRLMPVKMARTQQDIRNTMRHELAHIAFGDCDAGYVVPILLRKLGRPFREWRADAYADGRLNPPNPNKFLKLDFC